jgi:diamine N-acetyltransferase
MSSTNDTEGFGPSVPTRSSCLAYHRVTEDNWRAVASLTPKEDQIGNLAPNDWSLCESHYDEDAWVRAN